MQIFDGEFNNFNMKKVTKEIFIEAFEKRIKFFDFQLINLSEIDKI